VTHQFTHAAAVSVFTVSAGRVTHLPMVSRFQGSSTKPIVDAQPPIMHQPHAFSILST
jgi:hypothetical protein